MIDTCEYPSLVIVGNVPMRGPLVSGFQVGRFAIRYTPPELGVVMRNPNGGEAFSRAFNVDHIGTGACVADFSRFEDAVAFADDVSRFAPGDPDTTDPHTLRSQLGPVLCGWGVTCRQRDSVIPLRDHLGIARLQREGLS